MISGWRGRIGRAIPDQLLRKHLSSKLNDKSIGFTQRTIQDIRTENFESTTMLARTLGLEITEDANSSSCCISQVDWPVFRAELLREGYAIERISEQHSVAAESAWGVARISESNTPGVAAVWQVYPGPLAPNADAQDFVGPIDVVYTWVDSQDPQWAADYREALGKNAKEPQSSSTDLARYTSRNELMYSLRSLEMNLPWVNHIYLVTAGQKPEWLVDAHPKLSVVEHRDIFTDADDCLPTFNSHAIESQLVNIPGLNEHFVYVNDDVFFGRYLSPNTFFGPAGQTKYCLTKGHFFNVVDPELPVNRAAANNRELVIDRFGRTTSRKFQHVAHPQRKEVHRLIHDEYGARVTQTARQRFRSDTDISIPSSLAHHFAARLGLGFPTSVAYQYVDIGTRTFYLDMLRLSKNFAVDMFCINDVLEVPDPHRSPIVQQFLASKFPLKSSFER